MPSFMNALLFNDIKEKKKNDLDKIQSSKQNECFVMLY